MKNKEKTAFLNVESKKTIYLQRSNRRVEPTRASDIHHLGHTFVAWHSEAVKRPPKIEYKDQSNFKSIVSRIVLAALFATTQLVFPQYTSAQDSGVEGYKSLIPQAPDAQALARAIDVPVNAYTGIPQISIPLYEINVGGLSIPITLSYHAGGILANQEATEVGLGWSLLAGGTITRTIKCIEDFDNERGYLCYSEDWDGDPNSLELFFDCDSKIYYWDMEPDIFYFSTPFESGKFFFSHDKQAHFLNKTANFRLADTPSSETIELMDANGFKYQYEDIEETQTYTYKSSITANTIANGFDLNFTLHDFYGFQESEPITSAWKLSRIILPKGDTISFYYECIKYQLPLQESAVKQTQYKRDGSSEGINIADMLTEPGLRYTFQKCIIDGKRLSEIRWRGGSILFEAENRDDILSYSSYPNSKAIKAIKVKDAMGNTVKHWLFDYSYFNQNTYSSYPHLFKRLKLQSIKEVILSDSIGYCFNYNEKAKLPAKNTKNTDFWGYYNGSKQDSDYVCPVVIDSVLYTGGDKRTDTLYSRLGMLVSMTCPTGGTTTFTYENNTVTNGEYSELCQNRCCLSASRSSSSSGSPIACDTIELNFRQKVKIYVSAENKDNINTLSGYDFVGTTDTPFELFQLSETGNSTCIISQSMPDYWDNNNGFHQEMELTLQAGRYVMRVESIVDGFTADMEMQYSSLNVYHDGDERFVGGLRIARLDGEKSISYTYSGGTLFKKPVASGFFSAFSLNPYYGHIIMALQHSESVASLSTISSGQIMGYSDVYENYNDGSRNYYQYHNEAESYFIEGYPLAGTQTDWLNGSLIKRERYGSSDLLNHPKETTSFVYSQPATGDSISGFVFDGGDMINYKNIVRNVLPIKIMQTTQLGNGARSIIYSKGYDENFQCVSDTVANGNDKLVTRNFYPYNLSDSVSIQMVEANTIGSPVAQLKSRNGTIFDGSWTRYGKFDGRILPSQELRLNTDQATANLTFCLFDTIMEYKNYDKYGNPRWMSYRGTPVTCLWGYRGQYPIIEVVGTNFNTVESVLSSSTVSSLLDATNISSTQLSGLHGTLQNAFSDFSVTSCRYLPLVGPAEIINPDGTSATYEYDVAGRLIGKRLNGTELLQRYSYHYGADNYRTAATMLDSNASDSLLTVQYYDQWGRPSLIASQEKSSSRKFSYALQTYDFLGRPSRAWNTVPTNDSSPNSMMAAEFASESATAYGDTLAFSETTYDVLGNVVRETIPGEAWKPEGRQNTFQYLTNTSNEVKRYSITSSGGLGGGNTFYPSGTLLCTRQRDPDGKIVKKYQDVFGNVILERRTDSLETFDTYYVYDALNRLRMVLSPKCQVSTEDMAACRYEYRYNGKGQVIWKRLPSCDPIEYWYNKQDQLVCMQDGCLRSNNRYRFFIYDRLGRLCIQGITPLCYQQTHFSFISQTFSGPLFKDTGYRYLGDLSELSPNNCTLELVNYYDGYNYISLNQPISGVAQYASLLGTSNNVAPSRLTGTRQYASNGEAMLTTFAYDDRGRIHKAGEFGLNGILTMTDYHHNFFDGIDSTRTTFLVYTANTPAWTGSILQTNTYYQHTALPHTTTVTITKNGGSSSSETVTNLQYDALGNITNNDRGGTAADMTYTYDLLHGWVKEITSSGGFEQKLYREDNTGTKLFNGSISAMTWKEPGYSFLRQYNYTYDGINRLTEGRYYQLPIMNPVLLQGTGEELAGFGMEEESMPLGLIPVIDGPGNPILPNFNAADRYTERISYDSNSNITSVERYGMNNQRQYGLIDSLVITRNGNQLKTIEDYAEKHLTYTGASDFYDGSSYGTEYYYNANGALESDINRDIDLIQYDALGNTRCIYYFGQNQIEYIYAADGTKLRTIHRPASSSALTDSIDYIGNLILKNGQPSMYLFEGGYATFNANGAVNGWHYYIQDYMGNNRMVVNKNGTTEQVTHYYPYGGVIGDISTNENLQKYKFEGKELDRTFGLDNYDIHARQYFAMMPTWDRIDPLAENTPQFSPYSYCGGNPINFGDYNGMDWYGYKDSIEINGVMTETYSIRYTEYTSQEELDKNNISGDYLGKRVVSIMGSYNEVLDDSKMIDGEKTIHATARVYINPEDETTPTEYIAFTMSSDYNKYGAIKDGNYNVTYRESPGGGKIPKHYEIEGPVDCIDDRNNSWYNGEKDAYSPTQKNNVFVHRTNTSGYAGDPVSKGCILINGKVDHNGKSQWTNFENQIGNNGFKLVLRRR